MTTTNAVDLLIGVAVLGYILYGQMQARLLRTTVRMPVILAVIGAVQLTQFLQYGQHGHHGSRVALALAGSLVLAAVTAAVRALTVRLWIDGGQVWRQGNWLTAVLWVASLGVHLGYDYLVDGKGSQAGLGSATLLLYFAVTYAIQRLILRARAQRIAGVDQDTSVRTAS